jgi:hypothetical protein
MATSTVWCDPTSTLPSDGPDEPGGKLLAAKNVGALKLCPPSLSFARRSRIGTPAFARTYAGSNAKLDNRTVIVISTSDRAEEAVRPMTKGIAMIRMIARQRMGTLLID